MEMNLIRQVKDKNKKVSKIREVYIHAREVGKYFVKMVVAPRTRTPDQVKKEYHTDKYLRLFNEKGWLKHASLLEYLNIDPVTKIIAHIDGSMIELTIADYYKLRREGIKEIFSKYSSPTDHIVELGGASGHLLLGLAIQRYWKKHTTVDISKNAILIADALKAHYKDDPAFENFSCQLMDITTMSEESKKLIEGNFVYTHHCLEQLKYNLKDIISALINLKPKYVAHIEPTTELLEKNVPIDITTRMHIKRMDYTDNLIDTLREFEKMKKIQIMDSFKMPFSSGTQYKGTFVIWRPL